MALIEIILGERPAQPGSSIITFDPQTGILAGNTPDGVFSEPVAPLRERFAKLKARDNLLGAVLARLGADPGARETEAHNAVGRLLADREAVSKIADCYVKAAEELAQGLGLSAAKPDELADQVLAMNTELTAALAKAEAKRDEAIAEAINECKGRAAAEAEVRDLTSALEKVRRELDEERLSTAAKIDTLTRKLAEADLERMLAEARLWGLASQLQHLEVAMREKLRA